VETHIQQTINQPPSDSVALTETHTCYRQRNNLAIFWLCTRLHGKYRSRPASVTSSYHLPFSSPKQKSMTFSECQNHAINEHTSWRDVTYSSMLRHPHDKSVNEFSMLSLQHVQGQGQWSSRSRPRPVVFEVKASDLRGQGQGQWSLRSRPVIFEVKAKASDLWGQCQGQWSSRSRSRPRPDLKAKATTFCLRTILGVDGSPQGPAPDQRPLTYLLLNVWRSLHHYITENKLFTWLMPSLHFYHSSVVVWNGSHDLRW